MAAVTCAAEIRHAADAQGILHSLDAAEPTRAYKYNMITRSRKWSLGAQSISITPRG
jgi:hypothetical protein